MFLKTLHSSMSSFILRLTWQHQRNQAVVPHYLHQNEIPTVKYYWNQIYKIHLFIRTQTDFWRFIFIDTLLAPHAIDGSIKSTSHCFDILQNFSPVRGLPFGIFIVEVNGILIFVDWFLVRYGYRFLSFAGSFLRHGISITFIYRSNNTTFMLVSQKIGKNWT